MSRRLRVVTSSLVAAAVVVAIAAAADALAESEPVGGSDGSTFGVVVVDRETGETEAEGPSIFRTTNPPVLRGAGGDDLFPPPRSRLGDTERSA